MVVAPTLDVVAAAAVERDRDMEEVVAVAEGISDLKEGEEEEVEEAMKKEEEDEETSLPSFS